MTSLNATCLRVVGGERKQRFALKTSYIYDTFQHVNMSLEIKVYALVFYLMNDISGRDIVIA